MEEAWKQLGSYLLLSEPEAVDQYLGCKHVSHKKRVTVPRHHTREEVNVELLKLIRESSPREDVKDEEEPVGADGDDGTKERLKREVGDDEQGA